MKFRSAYSEKKHHFSCTGSPEYTEVRVRRSPDGNISAEYGKKHDRQAEINSYKGACDVKKMIQRFEAGDETALMRNPNGVFADLSALPRNIHEAQKLRSDVNALYEFMGDDIKARYRNVNEFCEAFSSQDKFKEFLSFSGNVVKDRQSAYKKKTIKTEENVNG